MVQPGEQTQTVTVTGELPSIDTTDATLGGTVSNESINALPLNGRNFDRLLQLRPGVVPSVGGGSAAGPQTNGRRNTDDQLRVDGIAGMAQAQGSDILNATYRTGDADSLMPIDAIQEFNTEQNPKAEYGFRDGAIVNVGVKSGTNSIHGTAYAFGRDGAATDSANYFTGAVNPATLEQFGATAGGPIIKDKLFWFAGFEGLRLSTGDPSQVTIPVDVGTGVTPATLAQAQASTNMVNICNFLKLPGNGGVSPLSAQLAGLGNFATGSTGSCTVTPSSSSFENVFPFSTTGTLNPPLVTTGPLNNGLFKADYIINSHHHVGGMYFVSKSNAQANSQTQQIEPQWETVAVNDVQQYDGSWTWTPNSTLVNDFRAGYVYMNNATAYADQNMPANAPWPSGYAINTGVTNPLYGGFPYVTISNLSTMELGAGPRSSIRGPEGDADFVESVSYLRGKHTFKVGFEYIDVVLDGDTYTGAQGVATFQSLETFVAGSATYRLDLNRRSHRRGAESLVRVIRSGRLADRSPGDPEPGIALGVLRRSGHPRQLLRKFQSQRQSINDPFHRAVWLRGADFRPNTTPEHRDFSPRVGFAWDVQGNGKTVVRAGAGVFRDGALIKSFISSSPFGATFFGGTAASPVLIGPNNSGTPASAHTSVIDVAQLSGRPMRHCPGRFELDGCGSYIPDCWRPTIGGVTYTGQVCAPTGVASGPCPTSAVDPNFLDPYSDSVEFGYPARHHEQTDH